MRRLMDALQESNDPTLEDVSGDEEFTVSAYEFRAIISWITAVQEHMLEHIRDKEMWEKELESDG